MIVLPYGDDRPRIGAGLNAAADAAIIGRATLGAGCHLGQLATLRADGEDIIVGGDCWFADFSTVHIADGVYPTRIADGVSVARFGLAHACQLGPGCIIAEHAVVMDDSKVGPGAVIAADSVVPPGKTLAGGWLYAGTPAKAIRPLETATLARLHRLIRDTTARAEAGDDEILRSRNPIAALRQQPGLGIDSASAPGAFIAPSASITGTLRLAPQASIWFGVEICAGGATVELGAGSNIQDNTRIVLDAGERVHIGRRVTVGHNVRMAACEIGNEVIIGMGSSIGIGTIVGDGACVAAGAVTAPGTVVTAGYIWSGDPACQWKPLPAIGLAMFARGVDVYIGYSSRYATAARAAG